METSLLNYQSRASTNEIAGEMSIQEILSLIKNGNPESDILINKARSAGKGTIEYDNIKKNQLPAFIFNFKYNKELANKNIISGTGFLYLDIDKISNEPELLLIKEKIKQLPFVYACWKSLSELGLSILVSVEGLNSENYIFFKTYFLKKYKYNADTDQGFNWDTNTWKQTQKTVLSKDSELYVNESCIQLTYTEVYEYCFLLNEEKVHYTNLISEKRNSQGYQIAPYGSMDEIDLSGLDMTVTRFNDKYKYAEKDKEFTVYPDGVFINELYFPEAYRISEGKRRTLLHLYACKYIRINGESFGKTYNFVKWLRDCHCHNPKTFSNADIKEVVISALKSYKSAKIKMKRCVVIFPEDTTIPGIERKKISGTVVGKIRTDRTIQVLNSLYKPGMRQVDLIAIAPLCKRTVKDYWNKDENGNVFFARPIRTAKKKRKND